VAVRPIALIAMRAASTEWGTPVAGNAKCAHALQFVTPSATVIGPTDPARTALEGAAESRGEGRGPGSPALDAPRLSVYQDAGGGLMSGDPSGGKTGPPSDRFITVQDSDIPRAAKTKMT
jgi:hypothetical protein